MNVIEFPDFTTLEELADVDRYLTFLDDIYEAVATGDELLAAELRLIRPTPIITGFYSYLLLMAVAAALAYEAMESMTVEAKRLVRNRERRKLKKAICASRIIGIIERHRAAMSAGMYGGTSLKTVENTIRYQRRFKSRA